MPEGRPLSQACLLTSGPDRQDIRLTRGVYPKGDELISIPQLNSDGDLPAGIHPATLRDLAVGFGSSSRERERLFQRIRRIHRIASDSGHLARLVVYGSFVTAKPVPNDVDVFLVMHDTFDLSQVTGEARLVFDHPAAQAYFGASIFWLRQLAALPNEEGAVLGWQLKRDGTRRGIVEVMEA